MPAAGTAPTGIYHIGTGLRVPPPFLPGHHIRIIEGVEKPCTPLLGNLESLLIGLS